MAKPARDVLRFPTSDRHNIDPYVPPSQSRLAPCEDFDKPFVTLTFATSLDSQLAVAPGMQTALSGPQSKAMTHYLRSKHDAILIGVGTAIADNPSLNCRIEGVGGYGGEGLSGQPRPIVIDPTGRWNFTAESKVVNLASGGRGKGPFIITCVEPSEERKKILENVDGKFVVVQALSGSDSSKHLDWYTILQLLAREDIKSVMIEGGGSVINNMLSDPVGYHAIDSVIITVAPTWLGQGGVQVCPPGSTSGGHLPTTRLKDVKWIPLADDVVLCGRPNLTLRS
ncbi:2,5-diamino-6-(ribosylamino)-4(3H)-pyrimidinone 5'-phosphate reductase [Coniothyrium glycines]